MKINLKFLKHEKSFKKGGLHTKPEFFWNILLGLAIMLTISSFVFGFFTFKQTSKEPVLAVDKTDGKSKTVTKERIEEALQSFFARDKKSAEIINSPSPIIDPSI